jgi:hypothetical protein
MAKARVRALRACGGPLLDPTSRLEKLQQNQLLVGRAPATHERGTEIVVNGVKTIMVNEPLRARTSRRFASAAMLERAASFTPKPSLPGLTRQSIPFVKVLFTKGMDARVKPAHDASK